ncbi:MAG: hypothetical protein ACKVVT_10620 [Dehalococcoidia bacterium]
MADEHDYDDDALGLASLADEETWFFDLPSGAWERQEEKNRTLRQNLVQNLRSGRRRDDGANDAPLLPVDAPPVARRGSVRGRANTAARAEFDEIEAIVENRELPPAPLAPRPWDELDEQPAARAEPASATHSDEPHSDAEKKGLLGRFFRKPGKEAGAPALHAPDWLDDSPATATRPPAASGRQGRSKPAPPPLDGWDIDEPPAAEEPRHVQPAARQRTAPGPVAPDRPGLGPQIAWNDDWLEAPEPDAPRAASRLHARAARAASPIDDTAVYPAKTEVTELADSRGGMGDAVPKSPARLAKAPPSTASEPDGDDEASSDPWAEYLGRRTANGEKPFVFSNNRGLRRVQ